MIDNLNCDGLIAAYNELTRSIELPLIDEQLGNTDPEKPKVTTIHCGDNDKARFDALAIKLGTQTEQDTFAALLSMAEAAIAKDEATNDEVTNEAEASTQTNDFSEALATLEAKLRSEFELRLQQLELLVESKVSDNSAATIAPNKSKPTKLAQVAANSVESKVNNENNDDDVPRQSRRSAETKISNAVTGVMNYNDTVATEKADKWHISESLIARLTGCNRPAVRKLFENYATMISDHNAKHELHDRHNTGRSEEETILKDYLETFEQCTMA
jgi:hypothetical protein